MKNQFVAEKLFYTVMLIIALPILIMILASFNLFISAGVSINGYKELLQPVRLYEIWNIVYRSFFVSIFSVVIAYMSSYILIMKTTAKFQRIFLIIITLPFLANEAVRVFSWQNILAENGLLNELLHLLGFKRNIFDSSNGANIYITMVAACMPFAIFISTATLKVIPEIYWRVCGDLKLNQFSKLVKVALPMSKIGLLGSFCVTYFISLALSSEVYFLGGATKISMRGFILSLMSANRFEAIFSFGVILLTLLIIICSIIIFFYRSKLKVS